MTHSTPNTPHPTPYTHWCRVWALIALLLAARVAAAQEPYKLPPAPIPQILDAAPIPAASVSPDRAWLLVLERASLPPISEVAAPELRLAGERINPRTNGPSRELALTALRLVSVAGGVVRPIEAPRGARLGDVRWSPDAARIAFTVTAAEGIELWVADVASGKARQLTGPLLNATTGIPCTWIAMGTSLICRTVPSSRPKAPKAPETPTGPVIQESEGRAAPNRTYQDLLGSPSDEALFDHYFSSQLSLIGLDGSTRPVGAPAIFNAVQPSPDGRYVLVEITHRPFSYLVPMGRFPSRVEVWDLDGKLVKLLADRPLHEEVSTSFDAVPTGIRDVEWRSDVPATLVWKEALDRGDPKVQVSKRDRIATLSAPFNTQPKTLLDAETRLGNVIWARPDLALVNESWWKTRRTKTWALDPSSPAATPRLLFDRSSEDRYNDPGRFLTTVGSLGTPVLLTTRDGRSAYLAGGGASLEGDRPFLDRVDLATGRTERLWRSEAPYYEEVVSVLDGAGRRAITRRESVRDVPNYFLRAIDTRKTAQLTKFRDPAPQFAGITSELIRYKRSDGVDLSATLYLPAGYNKSKGPLPFLFWAYPREFKTAAAAAQVQGSPYRFTRPTAASHLFLLTQGYGILDGPTMPIVGEGDAEPNDTYVKQLVSSAQAAVDKVVEMGVADRDRIAIGGHSYGAFMTANLLAHSRIFRAGIARSGAYNRTLTPFGFQAEERPFWQAREIYMEMSPFTYADSITAPLLLIHGAADDNSGTFPLQSERLYSALKGNGTKVRLVLLPAEAHGYRARESVGHTLWEMVTWLDTYVKNAPKQRVD
ncbi:MAG: prolyl oligopeptidase family serine peptidase [Gemmatimonadaceae bacterium]